MRWCKHQLDFRRILWSHRRRHWHDGDELGEAKYRDLAAGQLALVLIWFPRNKLRLSGPILSSEFWFHSIIAPLMIGITFENWR